MLGKLIKHEFRATGRILPVLFGILLVLSVFMAFGIRLWDSAESTLLNALFVLLSIAYGCALFAIFIVVLVLMVNRFRNNYLRDEGYVMFTLPVNVHQLVWSKAIAAALWFMATLVAVGLSALIVSFIASYSTGMLQEMIDFFRRVWQEMTAYYALNGIAILLEGILVGFVSYMSFCFLCYAALALGHGFDRHKMLLSVVFFIVFWTVLQILAVIVMATGSLDNYFSTLNITDSMTAVHVTMLVSLAIEAVTGAVFYFITVHSLQNRLNLE